MQAHQPSRITSSQAPTDINGLISPSEVRSLTGLSSSTIWREIKAGRFPAPVLLSPKRRAFRVQDVAEWIRNRTTATSNKSHSRA